MKQFYLGKATRTGIIHERHGLQNEDRAVIIEHDAYIWMGVFDGVSQGGGGGIAASIASQCMESTIRDLIGKDIDEIGNEIMSRAQAAILDAGRQNPGPQGMHTTGVIICIDKVDKILTWFSIGDSAAFVCPKRKKPIKLTVEDTDIGEMLANGRISQKEAKSAVGGQALNRCLGMIDVSPLIMSQYIRTGQIQLKSNDTVIICSDGFYSKVSPKQIAKLIKNGSTPEQFVKAARNNKSLDDITIAIAKPIPEKRNIQLRTCIVIAVSFFIIGILMGASFTEFVRKKRQTQSSFIYETTHVSATIDTSTINTGEYETH